MQKHSQIIADFVKYVDDAKNAYMVAEAAFHEQEKIECDITHRMELGCTYKERCKLATQLTSCLRERRYYKYIMNQTAPIVEWTKDGKCNAAFNQLKNALGKIRKEESYMETRTYKPKTDKVVW